MFRAEKPQAQLKIETAPIPKELKEKALSVVHRIDTA